MLMHKKIGARTLILGGLIVVTAATLSALPPTVLSRAYDADYGIKHNEEERFIVGTTVEGGCGTSSYDEDEHKNRLLSLYSPTQSSIAFLANAPAGSAASNLWRNLNLGPYSLNDSANDDYRGQFIVNGKYSQIDLTLFARYKLPFSIIPGEWTLSCYLPVSHAELSGVQWIDQTVGSSPVDQRVRDLLTSQITTVAGSLGGLNLGSWKRTGFGDPVVMLGWSQVYQQNREYLKSTTLRARIGLSFPLGLKKNQDQVMSLPFGNDGSLGMPIEFGLDLNFMYNIVVGGQVDYLGLFNATDSYRMKTDVQQTDFLIRDKAMVKKVNGATWRFMLHAGAEKIVKGLFADLQYQFNKHDEDRLYQLEDTFNNSIINTLQSTQNWAIHAVTLRAGYDCSVHGWGAAAPRISFYCKLPFAGRRSVAIPSFGSQLSFSF